MSRSAAVRMASRVVLPSRVLAAGLEVVVWILVVLMCTNWSVQTVPPPEHRVKYMGGPEMAPQTPPPFGRPRETRAPPLTPPLRGGPARHRPPPKTPPLGSARDSELPPPNPTLPAGPANT